MPNGNDNASLKIARSKLATLVEVFAPTGAGQIAARKTMQEALREFEGAVREDEREAHVTDAPPANPPQGDAAPQETVEAETPPPPPALSEPTPESANTKPPKPKKK